MCVFVCFCFAFVGSDPAFPSLAGATGQTQAWATMRTCCFVFVSVSPSLSLTRGVPPPLVFPGDEHLLAHAIESYARASYGGGAVASPVIVDATGSAAGGAFGLGRNLAGSTDEAAAAVAQAVSQTTSAGGGGGGGGGNLNGDDDEDTADDGGGDCDDNAGEEERKQRELLQEYGSRGQRGQPLDSSTPWIVTR